MFRVGREGTPKFICRRWEGGINFTNNEVQTER